jgi:hypothetical protein
VVLCPEAQGPSRTSRNQRRSVSSCSPVNKLLPFWAKDIKSGAKMINARAETVAEKPAYKRAFKAQRALIPVDAFYEWLETGQVGKSGKKLKQPFALPVNCTKHFQCGVELLSSERTWCDAEPASTVGRGAGGSA